MLLLTPPWIEHPVIFGFTLNIKHIIISKLMSTKSTITEVHSWPWAFVHCVLHMCWSIHYIFDCCFMHIIWCYFWCWFVTPKRRFSTGSGQSCNQNTWRSNVQHFIVVNYCIKRVFRQIYCISTNALDYFIFKCGLFSILNIKGPRSDNTPVIPHQRDVPAYEHSSFNIFQCQSIKY